MSFGNLLRYTRTSLDTENKELYPDWNDTVLSGFTEEPFPLTILSG